MPSGCARLLLRLRSERSESAQEKLPVRIGKESEVSQKAQRLDPRAVTSISILHLVCVLLTLLVTVLPASYVCLAVDPRVSIVILAGTRRTPSSYYIHRPIRCRLILCTLCQYSTPPQRFKLPTDEARFPPPWPLSWLQAVCVP